ncbi:hypothetical protein M6I34_15995 [Burkholderiaceae bacterium FT117]|uniref:hypothetical protein n=1 Tax=Zeimonas sediminis TaxID=2944268 RepID=UPI002342D7BD|nr:hypothetical protein [Zeimonas sediminis]MCM5572020.1 hypothetical protein [Zeimonas sediminis]
MTRATTAMIALLGGFAALVGMAPQGEAAGVDPLDRLPLQFVSAPIPLTIAGHAAVLRVVRADVEPEVALSAVAQAWKDPRAMLRRDEEGPWRNLSRVDRNGIRALQLRATEKGGSEGYLVGWQLGAEPRTESLAHRLLPPAATTLSDVASGGDSPGRTVVAWTPLPLDAADRSVTARAASLGLRPRTEGRRADPDPAAERSRHFTGKRAELAMTLHREGRGTALVIHLMEASK